MADAQGELDKRVAQDVDSVNVYTKQIATLNSQIVQREAAGVSAVDERDQRDVMLGKLSEKLSFQSIEMPNGAINCSLDNGFPLVNGAAARQLEVTTQPSFASGPLPPSLGGGVLSYVVFNFGTAADPSHFDLTQTLKSGQGSLAGELQMRGYADTSNTSAYEADGEIVQMASKLEAITRTLLTGVNQTYRGADEDSGTAGFQPNSADLNGDTPGVFGLFDFDYSGVKDANGDGLATASDLAATGIDSFSRFLKLGFSEPDQFAAARDVDAVAGSTSFPVGNGDNASAIAKLRNQKYDFALGSLAFTGTFDDLYNSSVSTIGGLKSAAQSNYDVAHSLYLAASTKRDEFSSVSLDEEFANVIKYQKAFQASAKMVKTASDLIDTIVGLI
jgi:flagellar hook-associated protein 1 FlgK